MPALRFDAAPDQPPRLIDCLGLPAASAGSADPLLSLQIEDGPAGTQSLEQEVSPDLVRYVRTLQGIVAETVFRRLPSQVWKRTDSVRNDTDSPVVLTRLGSRFDLSRGNYQVYTQAGGWCTESQGKWEELTHGARVLSCEHGRTSQGSTPFLALRCAGNDAAVAFHLLPRGNWRIELRTRRDAGLRACELTLLFGPDEPEGLRICLQPGEEYALPSLLLVPFASECIENAAPALHAAIADMALPVDAPPLAYNTWLDQFAELDVPRLERQLAAAKEVGCEVFVIDAGWYGSGEGWACQGDWQEKTDRSFHGRMREFADKVRAAGLGFGLWMEPEAIHPSTPLGQNPPPWLRCGPTGMFWPDLTQPEAYAWLKGEMCRLLDTYKAVWMKIDFNQPLGPDPERRGLHGYYEAWYRLLADLRDLFPQVFFENCASGAMRLDLLSYQHFHGHFLSDTVHPVDSIRIRQGTLLRLPPGTLYTWTVLAPAGAASYYPHAADHAPARALTPFDATWWRAETTSVSLAMAAALPGMPGLSGDLAGLASELRQELADWVSFWKANRSWLRQACAHLLTPVRPLSDNTGWTAFEFADQDHALVLAYRLNDLNPVFRTRLRSPDPAASYRLHWTDGRPDETHSGLDLLAEGVSLQLSGPFQAVGLTITRLP